MDSAKEGICRGIERHISEAYSRKYNNEWYRYIVLLEDVSELRSGIIHVADNTGASVDESLLIDWGYLDEMQAFQRRVDGKLSEHALGNCYFLLQEESFGKGIYKGMISNTMKDYSNDDVILVPDDYYEGSSGDGEDITMDGIKL